MKLGPATPTETPEAVPHVVAWNLTRRCNLACAHCYIAAGSWYGRDGELSTEECRRITDEIIELAPAPMFILSGGEPLLRDDLEQIAEYAVSRGATVVVGTNGTLLTEDRVATLKSAGVTGVAVSIESLESRYHDRFRKGHGALEETLAAVERMRSSELDFVVQTTVTRANRNELGRLAAWSAERGAVSFNVYFLVSTGRGESMSGLSPEQNEAVLRDLVALESEYRGRMLVRSKCQPQIMRVAHSADADSPLLNYATRCPCGVQYCRITPEGKLTPCPYTPLVAGDLRTTSFGDIWRTSEVFETIRHGALGGRCGACEYRKLCGGCRARAFAESGDIMATDESCAHQPAGGPVIEPARKRMYGAPAVPTMPWSDEAKRRTERMPGFVRGVVMARIEAWAVAHGHARVTANVMESVRRSMPVDFSKRVPFFMRSSRAEAGEVEAVISDSVSGDAS